MTPTRVVLVDDHQVVRRGIRSFLESFPGLTVVGEASSGEEALERLPEWRADVIVMDLLMPGGMDGIQAISRARTLTPEARIVVLTSSSDDLRVVEALRAGAVGYVRKDAKPDTLLASIRAAAQGQSLLDPTVAAVVFGRQAQPEVSDLTEREQEILRHLALGRTNREIAVLLVVSPETVKTHVSNILTKLQLTGRSQVTIYALKHGLITLEEIEL